MKFNYYHSVLYITPENKFEQELIQSEYLKTKLSYQIIENSPEHFLDLRIEQRQSFIDWEKKIVIINSMYSTFQMSYILRIVSDAYCVMCNSLPLHAAMITTDTKHIYILGNSGSGKSTLANLLSSWQEKISVVGDDHVIVSEQFVTGNTVLSVKSSRNNNQQNLSNCANSYVENLGGVQNKNSYFLIDVDLQSKVDTCQLIDNSQYLNGNLGHITKYLSDDFFTQVEQIQVEKFVGKKIIEQYNTKMVNFIDGASMIISVSGKLENVYSQLKELLLKEL
ncbi:MAG: hypothetical protein PHS59_12075 [Paludibacter sp.]|nr:hypothetical protein [Paludibacter sp.]